MLLLVRHQTLLAYAPPAKSVALRLKLFPASFAAQRVLDWTVTVDGRPVRASARNGYGDGVAQWMDWQPREGLEIVAHGLVEVRDAMGVVAGLPGNCPPGVFLRETPLSRPDPAIAKLAEGLETLDRLPMLHALSARVQGAMRFEAGITHAATSAADALGHGAGVCQDFAHVFISAARLLGVPARYVVGYLLAGRGEDQQFETHGWAEAEVPGLGWVGFDVANGLCATDHYVRLCCGLDADDAAPVRGIVIGGAHSTVSADVRISEGAADKAGLADQQQQQQQQQ